LILLSTISTNVERHPLFARHYARLLTKCEKL
jgi:hypothetical protein